MRRVWDADGDIIKYRLFVDSERIVVVFDPSLTEFFRVVSGTKNTFKGVRCILTVVYLIVTPALANSNSKLTCES